MKFGKRMMSLILAAALAAGTFFAHPVQAEAAAIAKGIDVSQYQGAVDWNSVKNAGYSFAFIKAGSAKSSLDPYFAVNMAGATAAGLDVGVYVYSYATTVEGAIEEAKFAALALAPFAVNLPVVYDLEDGVHKNMPPEALAALAVAFCSTVESLGYHPMIYSSKNWMTEKIAALPYDKWIAQYNDVCEYPNPAFWQFTSKGSVPGIAGNVDLNYQYKDYSNIIIENGWADRGGNRYFYKNYRKQIGWIEDNGLKYFMNADGTLYKNGWITDGVNIYYMSTRDGHMLRDWVDIAGKTYYFGDDGIMRKGLAAIGGKMYLFAEDGGLMRNSWYADGTGMHYFGEDGSQVLNTTITVDGVPFVIDASGVALPAAQ